MNEQKQKYLLELYKLLWEQIKDDKYDYLPLTGITLVMLENNLISSDEESIFDAHIVKNIPYDAIDKKAFVQRMIKELENDK